MSALPLPTALLSAATIFLYVDRLSNGKTPFGFSVKNYIGGVNGNKLTPYVPAIVGSLDGTTSFVANFNPNNAAYLQIASSPAENIAQVRASLVPNSASGPGVYEEAINTNFFMVETSKYTAHTFHDVISQLLILTNELCRRNPVYYNQTFTDPIFRNGTVTLYSPGGSLPGVYTSVAGYSASG